MESDVLSFGPKVACEMLFKESGSWNHRVMLHETSEFQASLYKTSKRMANRLTVLLRIRLTSSLES